MNRNRYPISIRDVGPHETAVRLTGTTASGMPSGNHTGGAWLFRGEVWKPMDGRPSPDSEYQYETDEARCLADLAGQPLFPKNWRIETRNGRRFIVRDKASLIPTDIGYHVLSVQHLLSIEAGVRNANRRGWAIGDEIALAMTKDTMTPFLYDLSAACFVGPGHVDENGLVRNFFRRVGARHLVNTREQAFDMIVSHLLEDLKDADAAFSYKHAYASFYRPVDLTWARFPVGVEVRCVTPKDHYNFEAGRPHTWILTKAPLEEAIVKKFELEWGWSPVNA